MYSLQHKHIVKSVDFSADDNLLLTASNEKIIRIYDVNNINSGTSLHLPKLPTILLTGTFFHLI